MLTGKSVPAFWTAWPGPTARRQQKCSALISVPAAGFVTVDGANAMMDTLGLTVLILRRAQLRRKVRVFQSGKKEIE